MRIAFIGCMVMYREVSRYISTADGFVHPFWIEQGLHDTPEKLRKKLQSTIDEIEGIVQEEGRKHSAAERGFDAIVLGYGLCSNSVIGLHSKTLPIVVPRCDDCIALFLGSYQRYLDIFGGNKGIYWYTRGWMQDDHCPSKEYFDRLHKHYIEEYDEDTADYLIEQETGYIKEYENLYFIKSDIIPDEEALARSKEIASEFGWAHTTVEGDSGFIFDMFKGGWDDRFLVCPPGHRIAPEYTGKKVIAEII